VLTTLRRDLDITFITITGIIPPHLLFFFLFFFFFLLRIYINRNPAMIWNSLREVLRGGVRGEDGAGPRR
jgi:hypothetical protein